MAIPEKRIVVIAVIIAVAVGSARGPFGVELPLEGGGTLVDHGFQLVIVDVGEGEVENFVGVGDEGWEEAVEEYGVEDSW